MSRLSRVRVSVRVKGYTGSGLVSGLSVIGFGLGIRLEVLIGPRSD